MSESLSIPSLTDLRTQTAAGFDARLGTAADPLRRRNIKVAAEVLAGLLWAEYDYLRKIPDLVWFIQTAKSPYLDRKASELGIQRTGATQAAGNVTFTGVNGIAIPAGTYVRTGDDVPVSYSTQASVTIAGSAASVAVVAVFAGSAANASAGAQLALATAIAGVQATCVVAAGGLTGGTDIEADDSLRKRLLARLHGNICYISKGSNNSAPAVDPNAQAGAAANHEHGQAGKGAAEVIGIRVDDTQKLRVKSAAQAADKSAQYERHQ